MATSSPVAFPDFFSTRGSLRRAAIPICKEKMSRFYAVESTPTNTSGKADHRLPVRASEVEQVARAIAAGLGAGWRQAPPSRSSRSLSPRGEGPAGAQGRGGRDSRRQSAAGGACAGACHEPGARSASATPSSTPSRCEAKPQDQTAALKELVADMNAGKVDLLVIMGAIRCTTRRPTSHFADAMNKVPLRVQHGLYQQRDQRACALARQRHALSRAVGRCARLSMAPLH